MKQLDSSTEYSQEYLLLRTLVDFGNRLGAIDRMKFGKLTGRQCTLIASIGTFEEPPTLGELAECEGSSHQNIKQMALKLQEKGYLKLLSDSDDARKIRVSVTEQGKGFCELHHEMEQNFLKLLLSGIPEGDIEHATQVMNLLNENLDEMISGGLRLK